jgi:hypothetical protein
MRNVASCGTFRGRSNRCANPRSGSGVNLQPRNSRNPDRRTGKTSEPRNPGTPELRNIGTASNLGTPEPRNCGTDKRKCLYLFL